MKITIAKSIIIDRDAVFAILKNHFKAKGYDVANIQYAMDKDKSTLHTVEIHMCHEEIKYEQNI